jgi:hypothetical protein
MRPGERSPGFVYNQIMSPTVLREAGYQFVIFTNDHPPPHVHARRAGNTARIRLDPVEILHNQGFNTRELGVILEIVQTHQEMLLAAWKEIHGDG